MKTSTDKPGEPEFPDVFAVYAARAAEVENREPWIHPICQSLATTCIGPFLPLADESLLTVTAAGLSISDDDGVTWNNTLSAPLGQDPTEPASCSILETSPGTFVMAFLDMQSERMKFTWNDTTKEPGSDACLELHTVRSRDGGKTWVDRQRLLDGWNGNFFGFIRTRSGRLVLVAEHLIANPGRWVVCSFISDDEGKSWQRSNVIDLGGNGHHDGATEPTVAELGDGRLLMLIRTNLGRFWQAVSEDGGRYWRTIEPSRIDASSAPGHLIRLHSGRLALVWNRLNPENWTWPLVRPDEQHTEMPSSWHREELSIALSGDDGKSWSPPLVFARLRGGQLSYPHVVERREGELWITAGFASRKWFNDDPLFFGVKIFEKDLLR